MSGPPAGPVQPRSHFGAGTNEGFSQQGVFRVFQVRITGEKGLGLFAGFFD